jgi:hypothetical protein
MEWISVDDRLPEAYTDVLVCGSKRLKFAVANRQENDQWGKPCWYGSSCSEEFTIYPPKYWMPLPSAPKNNTK